MSFHMSSRCGYLAFKYLRATASPLNSISAYNPTQWINNLKKKISFQCIPWNAFCLVRLFLLWCCGLPWQLDRFLAAPYMYVSIPDMDKLIIDIATCMILLCLAGGIAVPNNSSRFFWINHVATVPILNPITIDPIASYTGLPVWYVALNSKKKIVRRGEEGRHE